MALNYSYRPFVTSHTCEKNLASRVANGGYVEGGAENSGECYSMPWRAHSGEADRWNYSRGKDKVDQGPAPDLDIYDRLPTDPFGMESFTAIIKSFEEDCLKAIRDDLFAEWNCLVNNSLNCVVSSEKMRLDSTSPQINFHVYNEPNAGSQSFSSNIQFEENLNVKGNLCQEKSNIGSTSALCCDSDFDPVSNMGGVVDFGNGSTKVEQQASDFEGAPHEGSQTSSSIIQFEENLNVKGNLCQEKSNIGSTSALCCDSDFDPVSNMREVVDFGNGSTEVEQASDFEGAPHEGFAFALGYLGVKDLLSVQRVCRSLCSTVRDDPLLWRDIHIGEPLNEKLTYIPLRSLTSRAQGLLQSLNLVECTRVTDDDLRGVVESNPSLTKLCVPGCTQISIQGILNILKIHKNRSKDVQGIKYLRIGGLFGVTHEHYEELKTLLGVDDDQLHKPHFYRRGNLYLPFEDDRALDIEKCTMCDKFRLVYDCPSESCQHKDKICRACSICILRCTKCGRCTSTGYQENFSLEAQCFDCFDEHHTSEDPREDLGEPRYSLNG